VRTAASTPPPLKDDNEECLRTRQERIAKIMFMGFMISFTLFLSIGERMKKQF